MVSVPACMGKCALVCTVSLSIVRCSKARLGCLY